MTAVERDLLDGALVDDRAHRCGGSLDDRSVCANANRLLNRANLGLEILDDSAGDPEAKIVYGLAFETCGLNFDRINTGWKRHQLVIAFAVGLSGSFD